MILRNATMNFIASLAVLQPAYPQGQNSQNAITCAPLVFNALPLSMGLSGSSFQFVFDF